MRLYLDHDVDIALANRLRQLDHDVLTTREAGHTEASDEQQLAFATNAGRVMITHNRSAHLPLQVLERRLLRLFSSYTEPDVRGHLIPLHEFR